MDEIAVLRSKLQDLESKLEEANQRKMVSITNEWIVDECRRSINKANREEQLYLETNKVDLHALEEKIMDAKLNIPPNESIMTPLSRAIMLNPKGPWQVSYSFNTNLETSFNSPTNTPEMRQKYGAEFTRRMIKKHHSEMLKKTFPTATWNYNNGNGVSVTFPAPHDTLDEYKQPLLS